MIKIRGGAFFLLLAAACAVFAFVTSQPAGYAIAGVCLLFVLVIVLASTAFRSSMDAPESGKDGMTILRVILGGEPPGPKDRR